MNCKYDKIKLVYSKKDSVGNNLYRCPKCNRVFAVIEVLQNSSEIFGDSLHSKDKESKQ